MTTLTIEFDPRNDEFVVAQWDTYPSYSVLAGQERKAILGWYDTIEEAQKTHPEAEPSQFRKPQNFVDHLPGPDDQCIGGAWPDDFGGSYDDY